MGNTRQDRRPGSPIRLILWRAALILALSGISATFALAGETAAGPRAGNLGVECTPDSGLRYCDNGDGTVRDQKSGLLWLKEANCPALGPSGDGKGTFDEANAAAAMLQDGRCGLADGSRPGDWRLPTKQEWQAMLDPSFKNPAIANAAGTARWTPGNVFTAVQPEGYWSSSPDPEASGFAWGAGLFGGVVGSARKTIRGFIWPVRSP